MVDYNKDVSVFKKWLPVRSWLAKQKVPYNIRYAPIYAIGLQGWRFCAL